MSASVINFDFPKSVFASMWAADKVVDSILQTGLPRLIYIALAVQVASAT